MYISFAIGWHDQGTKSVLKGVRDSDNTGRGANLLAFEPIDQPHLARMLCSVVV
jgi:hypothetical protein